MKIFCIVGESGSGKTTVCKELEKHGINVVKSFTTRKPRYENEYGHIFTTKKQYECNVINKQILAETVFDGELYWANKSQFNRTCAYIVDPVGIKYLKENANWKAIVIYLKSDEETRYRRMVKTRGEDSLDRIEHDKKAFRIVQCDYVIDANNCIEEVFADVKSIIDSLK